MVMETPSPQCVGLEFVRQYYTVLNKAPMHLHRFFSHNSSFMHGGHNSMSEPIIGQADIHKMIMSLNFRDCHAKIRMVDAQATLGNGVVIQVTGELSNNGMPMRRFMQTFVLAPQTPKKFYVHNDIFRYQDEVFSDEEGAEEGGSEVEEDLEGPVSTQGFSAPSAAVNGSAHPPEPEPTPPAAPQTPVTPQVPTPVPTVPVPAPGNSSNAATTAPVATAPLSPTPPAITPTEPVPESPPTPENDEQGWGTPGTDGWGAPAEPQGSWDEPAVPQKETPDPDPPQPEPVQLPSNEPKTFANLFKNSQGFPAAPAPAASQPSSHAQPTPPAQQQPPQNRTDNRTQASTTTPAVSQAHSTGGFTQRPPRNAQGRGAPRDRPYRPNSEDNSELESLGGEERRRAPPVPDSQQIFVGNLPHTAGEDELKAEFSRFGKIMDIRINTAKGKTGPKGQVPNFGFITFEEEGSVSKALNSRPIHLNGEHRLNVEEKKARLRMDGGGMGRPNSGRGGMGGSGGMRQGPPSGLQGRGGGRPGFNRDSNRGGPGGPRGSFAPRR
ncbi:ras GTPase-activating protein-binding protein 2 isoform X1 [Penaeus vannamei]|uniref:Putative ras GTPase-activating protein-binding protein 2 n=2 Tax=Penaeus TaxID=133894 RepID=A0A3R7P7H2_PENVA|nr:ras GTPase-activating protein-binding protein 1-like [Penaeus vannamei]ROT77606.1 putative ras GTPase-activating protein-binding protein 2 [Penaeus vannamei]